MSTTIATPVGGETVALDAINALYLSSLVLDILSALLAFLTARWLELLTEKEKDLLEEKFSHTVLSRQHLSPRELLFYTWLGQSLFMPMPLLILGIACMIAGIYVYVWTQHAITVAAPVTLAGAATLPFIFGDFFIGKNQEKREKLITRLSEMRGDW
jgi:membrane protein implicated in regulation of membrane protease activity